MRDLYAKGLPFPAYLDTVQKNEALWHAVYERADVPETVLAAFDAVPGSWHLLVLSEDWCGDAANIVPLVARLAEALDRVDLRVVSRDGHPDLMNGHLTGRSRSIPVVIFLDEDFIERGWWGPRPSELQRWVIQEGLKLEPRPRYREIRTYYARDRGRTTLAELLEALTSAAVRGLADGDESAGDAHIRGRSSDPVDVAPGVPPTTVGRRRQDG